jgi:alpha/beta superfamily hydrolase
MTTGFGGTKDMILEEYAKHFVKAGIAVLTFDFRHFGASEGIPRQLFSFQFQLEDLQAAIAYARNRKEIDPDKIAVWSTSGSGGYGLMIAAKDKRIAAIVAQVASIDYEMDDTVEGEGLGRILQFIMHAQRDKGRSRFGLSPHTIPAYGKPGTFAFSSQPGMFEGISRLAAGSDFVNEICARSLLLMVVDLDPVEASKQVSCPVLFLVSEKDEIVPLTSHQRAAENLGQLAVVKTYPTGHFGLYTGEFFETAIKEQVSFLKTAFSK